MREVSVFRGVAGTITAGFVRPGTLLTALPVFGVYLAAGLAIAFFSFVLRRSPAAASIPILLLAAYAYAYVLGRFALPAARGELDAGFFADSLQPGDARRYALRYLLLAACWGLPLLGLFVLAGRGLVGAAMSSAQHSAMMTEPMMEAPMLAGMAQGGFSLLLLVLGMVLSLLLPLLTAIVAAQSDELGDAFQIERWLTPLRERRDDLLCYLAILYGSLLLFYLLYALPLLALTTLAFKISTGLGGVVAGLLALLPMALLPVIIGRMSGAFVYGQASLDLEQVLPTPDGPGEALLHPLVIREAARPTDASPAAAPAVKMTLETLQAKVAAVPATALTDAIAAASSGLTRSPRDAWLAAELCLLQRQSGANDAAPASAGNAIRHALLHGQAALACWLTQQFWAERNQLTLDSAALEPLGRALLNQQAYQEAAWCLHAAGVASQDLLKAQKGLLEVANRAGENGEAAVACLLYESFLKKYPSSQFAGFARDTLASLQRKS